MLKSSVAILTPKFILFNFVAFNGSIVIVLRKQASVFTVDNSSPQKSLYRAVLQVTGPAEMNLTDK